MGPKGPKRVIVPAGNKSSLAQRVLKVPREFFGPKGHYGSVSFFQLLYLKVLIWSWGLLAPDICTISRAKYASFRGVSLKVDIRLI